MRWKSALLLCAGVLLACTGFVQYVENAKEKQIEVIYVTKIIDPKNEFWTALLAAAQMAAAEENVKLTIVAPENEEDYERQNELIYWAIEQQPDVIMLSACDYTQTTPAAKAIVENKIPLVFVDSEVDADIGDCTVSTDNFVAGMRMGELAQECMDDTTQIAIVGHVKNSSTALERIRGFRYALSGAQDQIVDVVYCDSSYEKAQEVTRDLLEKYPDIGVIVGTNEYAAVGAAEAVRQMGYQDGITMIGFDNSLEQVQFLEEGFFQGIVIQKAFNMGYLGVRQAALIAMGEPCQKSIDSGSVSITLDNMNEPENQKLLFPFVGKQFREAIRGVDGQSP